MAMRVHSQSLIEGVRIHSYKKVASWDLNLTNTSVGAKWIKLIVLANAEVAVVQEVLQHVLHACMTDLSKNSNVRRADQYFKDPAWMCGRTKIQRTIWKPMLPQASTLMQTCHQHHPQLDELDCTQHRWYYMYKNILYYIFTMYCLMIQGCRKGKQRAELPTSTPGWPCLVDKGISAADGPLHLVGVDGVAVADLTRSRRAAHRQWWVPTCSNKNWWFGDVRCPIPMPIN